MSCKWNPRLDQSVQTFSFYSTQQLVANRSSYLLKSIAVGNWNTLGVMGVNETATAVDAVNTAGTMLINCLRINCT